MLRRWAGPLVPLVVLGGVLAVLSTNLETRRVAVRPAPPQVPTTAAPRGAPQQIVGGGQEYPIGDAQERNHIRIAAVWLQSVAVEGMPAMPAMPGADVIHLEADVHATEGNPNGFAKDEFVPYLKISYEIIPSAGGPAITGEMVPMVARDGLHYGASVSLPKHGMYRLIYRIRPPSEGGLGRHHDRVTGVAPWWAPFEVTFDWDYAGP